jgi:hypothetical protein
VRPPEEAQTAQEAQPAQEAPPQHAPPQLDQEGSAAPPLKRLKITLTSTVSNELLQAVAARPFSHSALSGAHMTNGAHMTHLATGTSTGSLAMAVQAAQGLHQGLPHGMIVAHSMPHTMPHTMPQALPQVHTMSQAIPQPLVAGSSSTAVSNVVVICKKCPKVALPKNYGFCADHRTSRGKETCKSCPRPAVPKNYGFCEIHRARHADIFRAASGR